ncbi:hypothetical protein ABZ016_01285 [Streptomyces sp. NPDC006372]|uniref:hypothetical protein n=1 Tax=Streptomyces sp. NPDC006372 TaxID=3155599 RepID=UPI0033B40439
MTGTVHPSFDDVPWATAFVRLANHSIACATCSAVDEQGWNLNLPCKAIDQLNEKYRQSRHWERHVRPL